MRLLLSCRLATFAAVAGLLAVPASHAATVSHYTWTNALNFIESETQGDASFLPGGTFSSSVSGWAPGDGRLSDAAAEANLGAGTLKAYAFVVEPASPTESGRAIAIASMGDTFYYSETPGSISFDLALDGLFSYFPPGAPWNFSYIELTVVPVGSLNAPSTSTSYYYPDLIYRKTTLLGPAHANNPGNVFSYCASEDCSVRDEVVVDRIADFSTPISYSFTPGGDFSWQLTMVVDVMVNNPGEQLYMDFGHTASLSYDGPTAFSESGVFPGTLPLAPIPEPGTIGLFLAGTAAVGLLRRRRR